jgi:N-acetylglucosamine-6-sulfatase
MKARTQRAGAPGVSATKVAVVATCLATGALVAGLSAAPVAGGKEDKGKSGDRPNVVVVMSDDQHADSMSVMSSVNQQIGGQGARFVNSFASFPLCCPSRATFLTGQYGHNHGVMANDLPNGGFLKLDSTNTLPMWLQQAGYYTGHIGKYLNGYEDVVPSPIPPGWTEWNGTTQTYQYYGYQTNENGTLVDYGTSADQYQTDVFTQKAIDFIHRRAPDATPFFLSVAYLAPHGGGPNNNPQPPSDCGSTAKPAPRHANAFDNEPLPQPPSFNEADVSDKPVDIQQRPPLDASDVANIEREYRCRLESILAVDEGVAQIVDALRAEGEFEDTVFVYTSDNGFFHGEHRVPMGKNLVYEPSVRVPLIVHGPGIPDGVTVEDLAVNADLAPTILDLTGAKPGRTMDGLSLLEAAQEPDEKRGRAILLETRQYSAVRTERYVYVEHVDTGERELYDLDNDPHQLQSLHADPAFDPVEAALANLLNGLRTCAGSGCRGTPVLKLKLAYRKGEGGCAEGAVKAVVKGADRGLVLSVGYSVGTKQAGSDDGPPFKQRIAGAKLKKHGRSEISADAALLDGREVTLDKKVRRCR